jgi:putative endonuclease
MHYVFIIYSKTLKQFYTGNTPNLDILLKEQNCGRNSDTRRGIPWILVYSESFLSQNEAAETELRIREKGAGGFLKDMGVIIPDVL